MYADDVHWIAKGVRSIPDVIVSLFLLVLLGTPISWDKMRGGQSYEWVGLQINLTNHSLGISEKRASWLLRWTERVIQERSVKVSDLTAVLGRLSYAAGPLERIRPFLSTLYAWAAAVPDTATLPLPEACLLVLHWIQAKLNNGGRMALCRLPGPELGEVFRADAKAEGESVSIGAWESKGCHSTWDARWFAVTLNHDNAPWVFSRGEPFRLIASLELLASLVAVVAFIPEGAAEREASAVLSLRGGTDNKGNTYVVDRLLTTKFPLNALLMELSEQLEVRNSSLKLDWLPRQQNEEADALTNGWFQGFDQSKRLQPDIANLPWRVLPEMLRAGGALVDELMAKRASRNALAAMARRAKKRPQDALKTKDPW